LGTRGSTLALWQTEHIRQLLATAWPDLLTERVILTTQGDRAPQASLLAGEGKGLFTQDLEAALREGRLEAAVHSLKDLPTQLPPDLTIGLIPARGNPCDVLVSRHHKTLDQLPLGATIGTSSRRRAAQLLRLRRDLQPLEIRGNVDRRIQKALDPTGPYDAIVLAYAGLERLNRLAVISQILQLDTCLPAPGQAALAVQCQRDSNLLPYLAPLMDWPSAAAVTAERAFLSTLGAGCSLPVAAYAHWQAEVLHLQGRVLSLDGQQQVEVSLSHSVLDTTGHISLELAAQLGRLVGQLAHSQGASRLLEQAQ
jgi:hydroxymethylbilane synthase